MPDPFQTLITKANGETEPYEPRKLRQSMRRAGANAVIVDQIADEVEDELYDGITTKEIYRQAFKKLKKESTTTAGRYQLKQAILQLGPTGYPFEHLVAALFKHQGFRTDVGVMVQGVCVQHEVDVIATRDHHQIMVECKFHNRQNRTSNVQVPLYIDARFRDIQRRQQEEGTEYPIKESWIVTNTRFTSDAVDYGTCRGLHLISWDYPEEGSLKRMIDKAGLHPVTTLTPLSNKEKQMLLDEDIVLCRTIREQPNMLDQFPFNDKMKDKIIRECTEISNM